MGENRWDPMIRRETKGILNLLFVRNIHIVQNTEQSLGRVKSQKISSRRRILEYILLYQKTKSIHLSHFWSTFQFLLKLPLPMLKSSSIISICIDDYINLSIMQNMSYYYYYSRCVTFIVDTPRPKITG